MAGEGEVFFHDMTWHEVTNETEKARCNQIQNAVSKYKNGLKVGTHETIFTRFKDVNQIQWGKRNQKASNRMG